MTIEVEGTVLTLRALNETKSAFVGIELSDQYFDTFHLEADMKTFSCKVGVKSLCAIFRSLKGIRLVKMSAQLVSGVDHELVFELLLMNGVTARTDCDRYNDCEVMSAVFDENECSYIRANPKLFSSLLQHIHQSPEVCVEAAADYFSIRSY
eukprot:CAMPEP_0174959908 /NCGR_PEP_ID=MMETSP0004_2-20121128/3426_1 /TAXON_ID=420556 /ORGANISM="Ochromonas sp., Strain CCMP1393" /LENGTH=151 /DNA_ID=CAMNT_0016208255 /DNA_START=196 /DNA_END=649 /DNA_ORIENTATION=-